MPRRRRGCDGNIRPPSREARAFQRTYLRAFDAWLLEPTIINELARYDALADVLKAKREDNRTAA